MDNLPQLRAYSAPFTRAANTSISSWSPIILTISSVSLGILVINQWMGYSHFKIYSMEDIHHDKTRQRIQKTYQYIFGGFALSATSATIAHLCRISLIVLRHPIITSLGVLGISAVSIYTIQNDDSEKNKKTRQAAWGIFTAAIGVSLSPIGFLDKALIAQAAMITLGTGGILTLTAYLDSGKKFLSWKGPLTTALTTMTIAGSIATFFPKTAFAYGMDRISLYGGIALFSGYMLYDTQKLKKDAAKLIRFDPIAASLQIYLNGINLFLKILKVLQENANKEERALRHY